MTRFVFENRQEMPVLFLKREGLLRPYTQMIQVLSLRFESIKD